MRFVALFIALCVSAGAWAQAGWPTKPIRIVVPVTTGGPSDLVARILGEKLSASLGKPVIIENRPGASMVIGSAFVAKSDADGYTLLQAAANLAINPYFMQDIPFDVVKDFAPVSLTHLTPYVFVVSAQSPVMSLQELIVDPPRNPNHVWNGRPGKPAAAGDLPARANDRPAEDDRS